MSFTNSVLRLIQAARYGDSQPARRWWLRRPSRSFRKSTGTSAVRSRMCTDLSTISDAYSQDCDWSAMRLSASVLIPRMPQWMSENRLE